jgi:hypothetical protein
MKKKEMYYLVDYYLNEGIRKIEGVFTMKSWEKHLKEENELRDKEDYLTDFDFTFTKIEVYN